MTALEYRTNGATVWQTDDTARTARVAHDTAIILADNEVLIRYYNTGYQFIGRYTGRTRRYWGVDCPTLARYDIDTVVRDGAIWGVPGAHVPGTWAIRPEAVAR
jgi:hypothetical protein